MRLTCRAAGLLTLAVVAITCTDAPTGPGAHRPGFTGARLAMAPSFSPAAARAYGTLEAMGIGVTQVRIRLRTADGTVARDTTIQYGAEDTLHIQISVEIQGTEQTFSALIELMDASGTVLFSQTQDVTARAASLPAAPPPTITLEYVGPGASARAITVTSSDVTVQAGVEPVLTAVGTDAAGSPVTDLLLAWMSSDATLATVTAVGRVATVHGTGRRGSVTITATSPTGLAGSARLAMLPPAARLAVISGDAQTSIAGALLAQPLVVELQGVDGGPIPGATVTFRAVSAGASVGAATATTDAVGLASTTLTLGQTTGTYSFEAASGALAPVTITATATAAAVAKLVFITAPPDTVTVAIPFAPVRVALADGYGNRVRTAGIRVRVLGTGVPPDTNSYRDSATTDGAGEAAFTIPPYSGLIGQLRLTVSSNGIESVSKALTAIAGAPAGLVMVQQPSAIASSGVPLAQSAIVQLVDAGRNVVAGVVPVTASLLGGSGTLNGTTTVTTATDGRASFGSLTVDGLIGSYALQFAGGTLTPATSDVIRLQNGPATTLGVLVPWPDTTSNPVDTPFAPQPRLQLFDSGNNAVPMSGVIVLADVAPGPNASLLTLGGDTTITDSLGRAAFSQLRGGGTAGRYVIRFSAGGIAPALSDSVSIAAGSLSKLLLVAQPVSVVTALLFAPAPTVQLADGYGNAVKQSGVLVSVAVAGASTAILAGTLTVPTDATGKATFDDLSVTGVLGPINLVFTALPKLSVTSAPITVTP